MPRLTEISHAIDPALRSDKSTEYLDFYEDLFRDIADQHLNVLEVGVFQGGSTLLFAQHFPNARILGVDIESPPPAFYDELERRGVTDRVRIALGSQADTAFLGDMIDEWFGGELLDVVIDDASHMYDLTRATFDALFFDHVKAGGIYVVEDWGCGYWPKWPDGNADGAHGLPRLVKELVDVVALEDRTREWQGERTLPGTEQLLSPIERAILTKGIAVFVRSGVSFDGPV
jgi:SAM-dependent methyltransferase